MAQAPLIPFDYLERQKRRAAVQTQTDDPIAKAMGVMRDEQVRSIIHQSPGPDLTAKVTQASRATGEPPALIEDKLPDIERSQQADYMTGLFGRFPALAKWAAGDPRGVAAAADDHKALGILGEAWDFLKKVPGRLGAGTYSAGAGLRELTDPIANAGAYVNAVVQAPIQTVLDAHGINKGYDPFAAAAKSVAANDASRAQMRGEAERIRKANKSENQYADALLSGFESIPLTIGAILTRNPEMATGLMGGSVGGQGYRDARDKGLPVGTSIVYGGLQGGFEKLTEGIPASSLIEALAKKTPFGKVFVEQLAQELPGEQVATVLQDFTEWAYLNPDKPFSQFVAERPAAAVNTALATLTGTASVTGATVALDRTAQAASKVASRVEQSRVAKAHGTFFDKAGKAAEQSKLRERDPEAYAAAIRAQAEETGAKFVYIPGEAAQAYMQSDAYDPDGDPFAAWAEDAGEAYASGGDIVIPIEQALTQLPGSPAWAALKDDMRLVAGGISAREAQTFDDAIGEIMGAMTDQMAAQDAAEAKGRTVRQKLLDSVAGMLGTGYTSPVARSLAELAVSRVEARAAALGQEVTGNEFDNLEIRTVLPESVALAKSADSLDLTINAMRGGKPVGRQSGPTLAEWIAKRGGINDSGGDIASMGGDKWHKGKVGRRKLIRPFDPQASMGGITGAGDYGVDTTLRAAVAEGFFPELAGQDVQSLDTGALLEALASEFSGKPRFASEVVTDTARAAADDLRQYLEAQGYNPDEMGDGDIRAIIQAGQGQSEQDGYEQEAKGRIIFDGPRRIIELFQSRNLSTAIHEFGHMWLEELAFDATTSEASDQLKADWETVKAWFADNGHAVDGAIPVEAHEMWARGVERYVMEGKAPTTGLKRLFETARTWMLSIYKTVEALRAPITPEIRSVMDRLLATDEQIAAMREDQALSALFNNAADIGMSEAEFAAYREQVADARAEAQGKVLEKAMRSERAKTTKEYREARKAVRADVEADVLTRPMFRAFDLLKTQPMDAGWIRDEMGEDALALLPKRVPPVYTDGGANPSTIAELAGYATGKQMIEALIGAEITHRQLKEGGDQRTLRNRMIDTETDAEMNRRYGDPLNDGSIEREALAAVHNDRQGEVIASELRVLARTTGNRPTPYAMAREWARGRVRGGVVAVEASPGAIERYRRAAAKAGRLAEGAMLEQNADEAFRQKQLQMLNNALVSEAKAAADEVEGAVKRMGKIAARKTMKSVDQDYLEQAQALLEAVDLKRRSQKGIERQGSWEAWAAEREAEGFDVAVPASFEATINRTNWTRLTVEQLLMLDEAVKQVMHLGRLKQRLLDNQEEREWEEIFTEAVSSAGGLDQRPPRGSFDEPTWWDNIKARVATVDAALLKMETVFDWLDRGNPNGVFNRIVFRPMAEAQANESAMLADYYGRIKEAMGRVPKETLRKWDEKVTLDLLDPATGLPITMSRQKLVSMALNIGNEGNLQRLTDGYGWNANGVMAALNDNLTEPEWRFVQETWDVINTLWPQIEAMERDINGFAPEKVDPRPVETPFGVLPGGYYPAIYDTSLDLRAEEQAGKRTDLFEANYVRATTRASATKDRAEKVRRPILLDLGVINRHLGEVIHDVTHRRAIMQAHRFLTNERVARAVEQALGPEVRKQFRPWLKHIANSWAMERAGSEGIGRFLSKLRANTTVVGMGFRFTTMLTQVAGYSNSFEVVGERWVAPAIAQVSAHPVKSFEFVMERSDEVRFRMDNLDRDIRQSLAEMSGKASPLTAAKRFAFYGIGYMDRAVVIPTWIGAYNKALSEGMTEKDAAYAADKAIRQSQGAGAPKDLAAVQTGAGRFGEAFKLLTMFYSYMSAYYQRQRTLGRDIKASGTRDLPRLMARAWWLAAVPPLLSAILTGNGPDDDEDWGFWILRKMLGNALGPIPLVRDVFEPAWAKATGTYGFDYQMSPVQSAIKSFVNVAGDAGRVARGEDTKRATRDVLETVGYATGLVPGQVAASTQFLVDVGSGDADPEGVADWYIGLTKGRLPED